MQWEVSRTPNSRGGKSQWQVTAVEPMLRECDYGRWTGRSLTEVQAEEPDAVAIWLRDPAAAPHGGEAVLSMIGRVGGWLDGRKANPGRVVAVTHASVIRTPLRPRRRRRAVPRRGSRTISRP